MAHLITLTPNKTYKTVDNAVKAVEKDEYYGAGKHPELTYFIHRDETTGRYFPVFIGLRALDAMVHFHHNVVA